MSILNHERRSGMTQELRPHERFCRKHGRWEKLMEWAEERAQAGRDAVSRWRKANPNYGKLYNRKWNAIIRDARSCSSCGSKDYIRMKNGAPLCVKCRFPE